MGSLVRESVEAYIASAPPEEDPLLEIIGMVDDAAAKPHGDVGLEHDAYLADAYVEEAAKPPEGKRRRTRS